MEALDFDLMWKEEKPFAERLAQWIDKELSPEKIIDIGCGPGMYVRSLRELGLDAYGYDIDPRVNGKEEEGIHRIDMFSLYDPADVVMCIEVAEHIPVTKEREVIESVARNTLVGGTLIWSAAHPGQGGVGHVNCQIKEYWECRLIELGMRRDFRRENDMLSWIKSGYHMGWFVQNAMVFVRSLGGVN
jgi:uncharacterized UPF0146 family protein